jgi:hypothetical protein
LPDWPGISAATFTVTGSGTGAALAQKKRVGCVEWALFRLFEIYDAEETRTVSASEFSAGIAPKIIIADIELYRN